MRDHRKRCSDHENRCHSSGYRTKHLHQSRSGHRLSDRDDRGTYRELCRRNRKPLATQAACKVLRDGGSAADALVAAQAVLRLVEPQSSGIGAAASSSTTTPPAVRYRPMTVEKSPRPPRPRTIYAGSTTQTGLHPDPMCGRRAARSECPESCACSTTCMPSTEPHPGASCSLRQFNWQTTASRSARAWPRRSPIQRPVLPWIQKPTSTFSTPMVRPNPPEPRSPTRPTQNPRRRCCRRTRCLLPGRHRRSHRGRGGGHLVRTHPEPDDHRRPIWIHRQEAGSAVHHLPRPRDLRYASAFLGRYRGGRDIGHPAELPDGILPAHRYRSRRRQADG